MLKMDNLEDNPFYAMLLTQFRKEFELACNSAYVLAIPPKDLLETVLIDSLLVNSHILMPSKLLKMHYTPLQAGFCDDIEIEGNKLLLHWIGDRSVLKKHHVINILNQEVGYNKYNKEYRMLLIDQLLVDKNKHKTSLSLIGITHFKLPRQLKNHDDSLKFLESISQYITSDLEVDIKRLHSNYMILTHYLEDAAKRMKNQIDIYVKKYENSVNNSTKAIIDYAIRQAIQVAIETYVVHMLHGKLMVSIYRLYDEEDSILIVKLNEIYNSNLSIQQLGAQEVFSEFEASETMLTELAKLPYLQSPLAIVCSLTKLVDLINERLKQCVDFKVLVGDINNSSKDMIIICSDDLIASFVYSIAQARPPRLYSISKYLEVFGWSSNSKDQAAYYTATFQIVVQYMLCYTRDQSTSLILQPSL